VSDVWWRISAPGTTPPEWKPVEGGTGLVSQGRPLTISLGTSLPAPRVKLEVSYDLHGVPKTTPFTLLMP
jgi:hypothetical protein